MFLEKFPYRVKFYTKPGIRGYRRKGFLPGMAPVEFIASGNYFLPFSAMVKKFFRIFPPSGVIMDSG